MLLNRDMLLDKKFSVRKKGGYDHHEVDNFLDEIAAEVVELDKTRQTEREEYLRLKDLEQALTSTMITAQKTSRQLVDEAQQQADSILAQAKSEAMNIAMKAEQENYDKSKSAKQELQAMQDQIVELKAIAQEFYDRIQADMESHLNSLKQSTFMQYANSIHVEEEVSAQSIQFEEIAQMPEPAEESAPVSTSTGGTGNTFDLNAFLAKPIAGVDDKTESDHENLHAVLENYAQTEASEPVKMEDELHMSFGTDMSKEAGIDMAEIYSNAPVSDDELKALIDELVD